MNTVMKAISKVTLTGLVLLSGMNVVSQSASAYSTREALDAYFNEGHGYCDAQMLSKYWNASGPGEAKTIAGAKILSFASQGDYSGVNPILANARQQYAGQGICSFSSDFSYKDAVAVAEYWGTSVYEAKTSLGNKLEAGLLQQARQLVSTAHSFQANVAEKKSIAFESLNRDGTTLGYFVEKSNGRWVEISASGQERFSFREVDRNNLVTTLRDDSRGVEIRLDFHFNQIQYKLTHASGAPTPLYAMSF